MFAFLLSAVVISLSGVMVPGPITAAALVAGARSRHAGATIALGHAVVEMPLILLLVVGIGSFLESSTARAWIGLAGGAVLLLLGTQLLLSLCKEHTNPVAQVQRHPFITGIVLTGANPYFLVWWATVGLAMATKAGEFGALALLLFAVVHWLCDLGWLEVLSVVGHKGTEVFGRRAQFVVTAACAVVLLGFGLKFLFDGLGRFAVDY